MFQYRKKFYFPAILLVFCLFSSVWDLEGACYQYAKKYLQKVKREKKKAEREKRRRRREAQERKRTGENSQSEDKIFPDGKRSGTWSQENMARRRAMENIRTGALQKMEKDNSAEKVPCGNTPSPAPILKKIHQNQLLLLRGKETISLPEVRKIALEIRRQARLLGTLIPIRSLPYGNKLHKMNDVIKDLRQKNPANYQHLTDEQILLQLQQTQILFIQNL